MRHSIVIPTYGRADLVRTCLTSLKKHEPGDNYEVIVVDDGSSLEEQRKLLNLKNELAAVIPFKLILEHKNKGFAATVNVGMKETVGTIVTLVNNDIVFIQPMLDAIERSFPFSFDYTVGIVGALLTYPNGTIQHGGLHYSPGSNAFLDYYKHKRPDPKRDIFRFELAVTGALFSIKSELIIAIGYLNEDFFLACEDTEYCLRAWKKKYRVVFSPEVRAIHAEGATRGNTPVAKQKKGPQWHKKELESIKKFRELLKTYDVEAMQKMVTGLNTPQVKKLEVGSGFNPHPGYVHVDVRPGLPQLDKVCDFSKSKLPYKNGEFGEVLANHVIEHISWRKLPFVVSEWARVLTPGGKLVLRTPNLRFIAEKYLAGETTPEHPVDEGFIKQELSDTVTPAWWANIKFFSGQDYEANFHRVCFDFPMLKALLERYGFSSVVEADLGPVFSPGELQVIAIKGRGRVLVRRKHALGDTILITPIVKRLRLDGWVVDVETDHLEVFKHNPYVNQTAHTFIPSAVAKYDKVVDLNWAYENSPKQHIIDAYSMVAFGDTNTEHKLDWFLSPLGEGARIVHDENDFITVHMAASWENRTWSTQNWLDLLGQLLKTYNKKIVIVGSRNDRFPDLNNTNIINQVGRLSLDETATWIAQSALFIGTDSSLLHIAQALNVPSIGLYTCAKAEYRATGALPIVPDIDCYGCLHDIPPPVTYCGCRRGDFKCLELITPEMVMEKVKEVLNGR